MNLNLECKYKQFAVEWCLKEVKTMDIILGKCKFPNSFLPYFQ